MKKFTKISLIIAAVAGGIGVLAVAIGLAMGAQLKDLEQMGIYINSDQVELSGVIRNELLDELEDEDHFLERIIAALLNMRKPLREFNA